MANDFLVFGGGAGANVLSQAAWAALTARTAGFSSGVAQSAQLNKAWRQSSIMAAVLAQFIADRTGLDVLDDGTTATILGNLKASAAAVNGDATKTFSVAAATAAAHATRYDQVFGVGQSLQNLTASRALGTVYTNSTGKPILIYVQATVGSGQAVALYLNGGLIGNYSNTTGASQAFLTTAIIPAGYTYEVRNLNTVTLTSWFEIRT